MSVDFLKRAGGPACGPGKGGPTCGDRVATFILCECAGVLLCAQQHCYVGSSSLQSTSTSACLWGLLPCYVMHANASPCCLLLPQICPAPSAAARLPFLKPS